MTNSSFIDSRERVNLMFPLRLEEDFSVSIDHKFEDIYEVTVSVTNDKGMVGYISERFRSETQDFKITERRTKTVVRLEISK